LANFQRCRNEQLFRAVVSSLFDSTGVKYVYANPQSGVTISRCALATKL